jgi:hypothetical protein
VCEYIVVIYTFYLHKYIYILSRWECGWYSPAGSFCKRHAVVDHWIWKTRLDVLCHHNTRGVTRISLYSLHVCTYVIYVHMYKKQLVFYTLYHHSCNHREPFIYPEHVLLSSYYQTARINQQPQSKKRLAILLWVGPPPINQHGSLVPIKKYPSGKSYLFWWWTGDFWVLVFGDAL